MSYALITGASKGIGKAIATSLAKRKYDLVLVARSADLLQQVADELSSTYQVRVVIIPMDLGAPDAAQQVYDHCVRANINISILVNNAGYGLAGKFDSYTWQQHQDMMTVNMNVAVHLIHVFLPMLKAAPQAHILNIVSTTAYQALPGLGMYAATKAFSLSFSRALQFELRNTSVSVTAVSPGSTDTDFVNRADMGPKARKNADKFNMKPEEVAEIAVKAMFNKKVEVIAGFVNKLGAVMAWLLPKRLVEKTAAGFYD